MKKIKIAHFVADEKFIDSAYAQFEKILPGGSDFFLATNKKKAEFIKKTPVQFISRLSFKNSFFIKKLSSYNFVMLHSLNGFNQQLVAHAWGKTKFVWIGMGYDYYDLIHDGHEDLLLDLTRSKYTVFQKGLYNYPLYKKIARKIIYKNISKKSLIEKIDYFSPVLENEYPLVREKFNSYFPKYVKWNYGITSQLVSTDSQRVVFGNDILIGNSASYTNNHLDIFNSLKDVSLNGRKIVTPLSYGDSKYGDMIEAKGVKYFGDNFIPIRNFMPFQEYMDTISQCSNVIMNHLRQQAGGNVAAMLFLGAKIFLNKTNPLYDHYISNGVRLFSIDELLQNLKLLDIPLPKDDVANNKRILKRLLGPDAALQKTRNLINVVSS
jgi:hypothetical protein